MLTAAPKENRSTPAGRAVGATQRKPSVQKYESVENSLSNVITVSSEKTGFAGLPGRGSPGGIGGGGAGLTSGSLLGRVIQRAGIHTATVQPKISVSSPDDAYEKEADQMADRVMSAPASISSAGGNGVLGSGSAPGSAVLTAATPVGSPGTITQTKFGGGNGSRVNTTPQISRSNSGSPTSLQLQREVEEEESAQAKFDLHRFAMDSDEDVARMAGEEEETMMPQLMRIEEEEEAAQTKLMRMEEEEEIAQTETAQTKIQRAADPKDEEKLIKPAKEEPVSIKYVRDVNNPKANPHQQVQRKPGLLRRMYRKAKSAFKLNRSSGPGTTSSSSPSHSHSSTSNSSSNNFESSLSASKGGGSPLPGNTKGFMESRFDADFSGVRVHTGGNAVQMSQQINAQAFTHGSDVYFNSGKYSPETSSGKHLLAHELTHTVQQGASVQKSGAQRKVQLKTKGARSGVSAAVGRAKVQRSWLGDAWDAVGDAASAVVDAAADALNAAIDYAKDKFADFARAIPGYKLLSVVLGQDPISGREVARNGRNFIEAGLDIIPFGGLFKQKLESTGGMEEAATWLDQRMGGLDISLSSILSDIGDFWDGLSLSDATDVSGTLERAANIIRRPIGEIVSFVGDVATEFLRIIKNIVITELATFVRDNTRGYPLLTVILGKDPITEQPVERNGMNLLTGFLELTEAGAEQRRQMEESGSLQRAADWIDGAIETLGLGFEGLRNAFSQAWTLITIENLVTAPLETFQNIVNLFAEPVGLILGFIIEVATMILKFIKDALLSRLSAFARDTRGYPLLTVILGKDPFTEERVPRNAENIIHGFMSLMEGGEEQFQQMKETGAIARMSARIEAAIEALNFTWAYIKGLFITAWESFSLQDLAAPFEAFGRIVSLFADPIRRLFNFVVEVVKMAVEIILVIMRFPIGLVQNIITKAMQAIEDIKRDPIGFFKNLLRAVKQGFQKFFDNILTHLFNGLTNWLFSELEDAGINPPADFSLGSIFGFVMDVLGITMERIWQKLADRIGQDRVDRVRGMLDRLEGIWTFVRDVMERGPIAIWEYIVEKINNLWDMVLENIRNWIMTRIIQRVTARLLSMLDPTGIMAVVNSVISLYQAIESFIRYIREMLEIVNSFVEGVAEIARGDTNRAATFLEGALARGIPVAIGFLANQVGLSGLGRRIGEMIESVREKVDEGLDWLIDRAVSAGTAFLDMARAGVARLRDWWSGRKQFTAENGEQHSLYFQGSGTSARLMIASDPTPYRDFLNTVDVPPDKQADKAQAITIAGELDEAVRNASSSGSGSGSGAGASSSGGAGGPGAAAGPDHASEIQGHLERLGTVTARFMPVGTSTESTPPVYGGLVNGFGSSVSVMRLTSNHPAGGSPSVSNNPHWQKLRRRMDGGGTYYVRGHLLNDNLGGPGNTWTNLTPLTQGANNRNSDSHLHGFETPVKNAVDADKIVNFVVTANYGRPARSADVSFFHSQGNPDDTLRGDIIHAEQFIPTALSCRANEVNADGSPGSAVATHTVNNTIDENTDHYDLTPTPKETVYLNEANKSKLMELDGIGDALAQAIIDNRPFSNYSDLREKTRIAEGRRASMQNTRGKLVRIYRR